jgi:Flp pilus assembly protein TadD
MMLFYALAYAGQTEEVVDRPDPVKTRVEVIEGMIDAGLTDQALALCAQLRADGLSTPDLDVAQARALNMKGSHQEAHQLLEQVLKKHPGLARAWSVMGVVLADEGKLPEALQALERAHRLEPKDPDILNNLGFVAMASGKEEKAVEYFQEALLQDPTQNVSRNNLGFALAHLERDQEALEAFRSAGGEAEARYNMGVACEWRKDRACAIVQYQAALEATPGYTPAVEALKKLLSENSP